MSKILPLLIIAFGFFSGGLLNFIIAKLYLSRNIINEECANSIKEQGWLRYLFWPFVVKSCPAKQQLRVFLVDLVFAAVAYWLWFDPPLKVEFWWGFTWIAYLAVVVVMDLEYRVVLLQVSAAGGILGLLIGTYLHTFSVTVLGGLAGYLLMLGLYKFGEVFGKKVGEMRGQELEEEALGFGDVYVSGILGLVLGWPGIINGLVLGILAGGAGGLAHVAVSVVNRRFKAFEPIPYAPYLVFGAVALLYFREIFLR